MSERTFQFGKPRYPQDSYIGRVRHFLDVIDPFTLFRSDEDIKAAVALLESFKIGKVGPEVSDEVLWRAKKVKDATIHPDTGDKIPLPFRMSAFVPVNLPIVIGMMSAASPVGTVFWQWVNQSYNVAVNYANRNATSTMTEKQIMTAYGTAVFASCSIALTLNQFVKKLEIRHAVSPPRWLTAARIGVPYLAVASAGSLNVFLMRRNEIEDGIVVVDKNGQTVGKSQQAGKIAISQVVLSRMALPAPILILPPIIMRTLSNTFKGAMANPRVRIPIELGVTTLCLWAALPAAIGLFAQNSEVPVSKLEPEFQNKKDKDGNPITHLYFNKGL